MFHGIEEFLESVGKKLTQITKFKRYVWIWLAFFVSKGSCWWCGECESLITNVFFLFQGEPAIENGIPGANNSGFTLTDEDETVQL